MMKRISAIVMMLTLIVGSMWAVPVNRQKITVQQPDGSSVTIQMHGDEWLSFTTTADGYSVVKNEQGYYVYATLEQGQLKATTQVAHDAVERKAAELQFLTDIQKYQVPAMSPEKAHMKQLVEKREADKRAARIGNGRRAAQYDYTNFKGLVILIEFNDKSFSRDDYKELMDDMLNKENYTGYDNQVYTGSVRDYFSDNSAGKFQPQFDAYGPYQVNYSCKKGNEKASEILRAAVNAADADINFKDYDRDDDGMVDMIFFIVAGNGRNYTGNYDGLWHPHRSVLTNGWNYVYKDGVCLWDYASSTELMGWTEQPSTVKIDGIGTICHEFSHVLGLPDFYDTNYEEDGESNHPGEWSLMASGSYMNDARTPVGYSLYERYSVGFTDEPQVITETGDYTLEPLAISQTGYRLNTPVNNEFFLLENRQKNYFKWDKYLPGSGMLVHRVDLTNRSVWDANTINAKASRNYYELVRANGAHQQSGAYYSSNLDAFPNGNKKELTNSTSPANLKTWNGKNNEFGIFNIQKTADGDITFTVDKYTLTGLTLDEEISIGVGTTKQLTATPTPEFAEFTLEWKSSNKSIATVDQDGLVKGVSEGECNITATSNNGITASCKVTVFSMPAYDIAAFKQQPVGEKLVLKLEDAEVLFTYTKNDKQTTYLRDQTGALMVSDVTMPVKNNDKVNGMLYVQSAVANKVPQAVGLGTETDVTGLAIVAGSEAQPREVTLDELTENDYSDLVLVKGSSIKRDGGFWAYSDNNTARIWAGNFGISSGLTSSTKLDGKLFNITAIYGTNVKSGTVINELNVTKAVEEYNETGIKEISNGQQANHPSFNLAGQRVDSHYKGLTIKNGKKYMNK